MLTYVDLGITQCNATATRAASVGLFLVSIGFSSEPSDDMFGISKVSASIMRRLEYDLGLIGLDPQPLADAYF